LDQLSFLTLRIGRLDKAGQASVQAALGSRAVFIPLDTAVPGTETAENPETNERIVAASSRKGRFALDTELRKANFIALNLPKDFKGVPAELITGLEKQEVVKKAEIAQFEAERKK
jgi:V/A-type H+-transporting ATPase subunit I